MQTHYQTLGVPPSASAEFIRKAYLELSRKHHPDKSGGSTAKFQEITFAYSQLKDPPRRKAYDDKIKLFRTACSVCDGEGVRWKQKGFNERKAITCVTCHGEGYLEVSGKPVAL